MSVEQSMQCFRPARQDDEVALQRFGKRIEQRPHVAGCELLMAWLPPLVEHQRDVTVAAHADVEGADDQIVSRAVVEVGELVAADAFVVVADVRLPVGAGVTLTSFRSIETFRSNSRAVRVSATPRRSSARVRARCNG